MFEALASRDVQDGLKKLTHTVDLRGECKSIKILIDAFKQSSREAQCACQAIADEAEYRKMVSLQDASAAAVRVLERFLVSDVRAGIFDR